MNADDLLRRALEELERADGDLRQEFETSKGWNSPSIIEEIRAYLADKNPSASISSEEVDKSTQKRLAIQKAKPPLNGDQILEGFKATGILGGGYRLWCFTEGVRFAERMRNE